MAQVKDILRTNYLSVEANDTLASIIGKLGKGKHTEAIVVDDKGNYMGMLGKRNLLRTRLDTSQTKVKGFVVKTTTLKESMYLEDAAKLMHTADFHVLPVLEGKKIIGICGARDVLGACIGQLKDFTAAEVGTMAVMVLQESDSMNKALTLLREKHIDRVPVVDKAGKLTGILSLIDLVTAFQSQSGRAGRSGKHGRTSRAGITSGERNDYSALPLSNVMTRIVVTAPPSTGAQEIVRIMKNAEISDVVLAKDGVPVGIITTKDLLRLFK